MGCSCTKNTLDKVATGNRATDIKPIVVNINRRRLEEKRTSQGSLKIKKNMFFAIQRKSWTQVLDFLTYKDLTVAGSINKALNKIARSQHILSKFYKNRRNSLFNTSPELPIKNSDLTQHEFTTNNFTTINNFNMNNKNSCLENKLPKCLVSLPTLTVEYDKHSEFKSSFASQGKSQKVSDSPKQLPQKRLKIQVTSPYVDMFSNQEIEVKLESGLRSLEENDSVDCNPISQRKQSMDNHSEKTPSFNQDLNLDDMVEIISITNITQFNIPKNKRNSNSFFNTKSSTLQVPNVSVRVRSAEKSGPIKIN